MYFKSLQSCPTLWDPILWPGRLLCPWDFPGKNIGVGCCFLLQGIFLTQRSNPFLFRLLHWQADCLPPRDRASLLSWINVPKFIHLFSSLWPFGTFLVFLLLWVKFLWACFCKSCGRFLKLHLGVGLLGHKAGVCLKLENHEAVSQWGCLYVCWPRNVVPVAPPLHSLDEFRS